METKKTIKLPFNHAMPSSLSNERINELNQLAVRAQLNDQGIIEDNEVDESSLVIETCAMKEVYEELSDIGEYGDFYYHIDSAFDLLLADRPKDTKGIFQSYKDLTSMFRIIEKQKKFIQQRWKEVNLILKDVDTLDCEDIERRKAEGGASCLK